MDVFNILNKVGMVTSYTELMNVDESSSNFPWGTWFLWSKVQQYVFPNYILYFIFLNQILFSRINTL